ncbi:MULTISPECIES: DUF6431 domain-containing protein [unclassified Streptomyces]|uniref:DUF6431 domain-containing protein n=1 Tax=unclassified Streptomyces TaxID=2593676 RepID=UPI001EF93609|nr:MULTISPECIES: DUF6431 domain-containing protein [unclassified Streptomyces]
MLMGCGRHLFVIVVAESETSVLPSCPACDAPLRPWGYVRERVIRLPEGGLRRLRPRRARCRACRTTHVLLPPFCLLRRADSVHTIAAALLDHVAGHGHRSIAERLHRPAATVRGWLRRATARAAFWRRHGVIYAYLLTPDAGPFPPRPSSWPRPSTSWVRPPASPGSSTPHGRPPIRGAPSPWSPAAGCSRPRDRPATASTRSRHREDDDSRCRANDSHLYVPTVNVATMLTLSVRQQQVRPLVRAICACDFIGV